MALTNKEERIIADLKKDLQTLISEKAIVARTANALRQLGYSRIRYYNVIFDHDLNQVLLVGRYSLGMGAGSSFIGYKLIHENKRYVNHLIRTKTPQSYIGRQVLNRNPDAKWVSKFHLINERFLDAPLVASNELVGLISVDRKGSKKRIAETDIEAMRDISAFAAEAIRNARISTNMRIMSSLASEAMKLQLDDGLLKYLVKAICHHLQAQMASIFLYDREKRELIRRETYISQWREKPLSELFIETYSPGQNLTGHCYKFRRAINATDLSEHRKSGSIGVNWGYVVKYQNYASRVGQKLKLKNAIFAPLIVENQCLGVIRVANNIDGLVPFPNSDLDLLKILANQIALIIFNAEAYQENARTTNKLAYLSLASDEMLTSMRMHPPVRSLHSIVFHAARVLSAENTAIFLVKKKGEKRYLHLLTEYGNPQRNINKSVDLRIMSGARTGLTGYAAYYGRPMRLSGEKLLRHPAVKNRMGTRRHLKSKKCVSFLSTPLRSGTRLIGLLKSENKYIDGKGIVGFSKEDEYISEILGDKIVVYLDVIERQKFLDSLVQDIAEPLVATDRDGRIIKYNEMASKLLGWREQEVIGKSVLMLHQDRASAKSIMYDLREAEDHRINDIRILCRTRSRDLIPISLSATLLVDDAGAPIGSIGIFRDMRELQRKEQEERMAHLGKTTSGMAHEIRGVFQNIKMANEEFAGIRKKSHAKTIEYCREIADLCEDGHSKLDWMRQLRDVADLDTKQINLSSIFQRVEVDLRDRIRVKNIRLLHKQTQRVRVQGDKSVLITVFRNLVENAIDASKEGSSVRITTRTENDKVLVFVRDRGHGITRENVKRLFDPFFSTKPVSGHYGIGLFLCKYLLTMMHDDVKLHETSKKGSAFVVVLKR